MKYPNAPILILMTASCSMAIAPASMAGEKPLKVIELFTSQGCSSCPPANANLMDVSERPDVLALSFSVTYWDYLGWKDTYGKPEFTQRQVAYEPQLRQRGPFTPQMVVNGTETIVGNDISEVRTLLSHAEPLKGPDVIVTNKRVSVGRLAGVSLADVWLVRYDPRVETVPVDRGENGGRLLRHSHVVHQLERLGSWKGQNSAYSLPRQRSGLKTAILVQLPNGGPILSAATD